MNDNERNELFQWKFVFLVVMDMEVTYFSASLVSNIWSIYIETHNVTLYHVSNIKICHGQSLLVLRYCEFVFYQLCL